MLQTRHLLLSFASLFMLSGCGGSDNSGSEPPVSSRYNLTGTVSGLTGTLLLDVNSNQLSINNNGTVNLGSGFTTGTTVNLAIAAQPDGQNCTLTSPSSVTFSTSDINTVAIACSNVGFTVSGVAQGLARAVDLQFSVNGQVRNASINTEGAFTLPNRFASGTTLQFSVPATVGHSCSVTPESLQVTTDFNGLAVNCNTFGQVSGQVNAYRSGTPITSAAIEVFVVEADGQAVLLDIIETDDSGNFAINGTGFYDRITLRATADNFVTRSEVVKTSQINPVTAINIAMLDVGFSQSFSATTPTDLVDSSTALRISLPANAFVDEQGALYSGQVTAAVTNIDASSDPAIMPGYYLALDPATNQERVFESFGALNASFTDDNGNKLQLAANTIANIRIPLASRAISPPATIPLIHFDEETGIWTVEGEASLMTDEQGRRYYAGQVNHFSTWNADVLFDSVNIIGCAVDEETQTPIPGVRLIADGVDYIGRSVAYTNANGEFSIAVRPNSQVLLSIRDADGQSNTTRINVGSGDYNLNNCITTAQGAMIVSLSWGQNPSDLDSHFRGPTIADSLTDRFHIYFGRRTVVVEGVTIYLDVDDISSFGPEIITVPRFPLPGRYVYSVHHYSGSGTVYQSPARVEVLLDGNSYIFSPSQDEDTRGANDTWMVFEVNVAANGELSLIPLDSYTSIDNNDIGEAFIAPTMYNIDKHARQ